MVLLETLYNNLRSDFGRQALINGNFDIWQRGVSTTLADATMAYPADKWMAYHNKNGGTLPTLTVTREFLTPGSIINSSLFYRLTTNGAGTSLGASSTGYMAIQRIEWGTRLLCGLGKTITISYYARSSIANKKLGVFMIQNYGTGGSPSSQEILNGFNDTLTSSWTKYTHTFTTNTLAGKAFGSGLDDFLELDFACMWGTNNAVLVGAGSTAETYVGSGTIDIAQVQVSIGEISPLFYPKSFQEELLSCQRYFCSNYTYGVTPGTNGALESNSQHGRAAGTSDIDPYGWKFPVDLRLSNPTITFYAYDGTAGKISAIDNTASIGGTMSISRMGSKSVSRIHSSTAVFTANNWYWWMWTAMAEL